MFNAMMILSCALSITGAFYPGNYGFNIFGIMIYIVVWQCLYMHRKYT